MILVLLGPHGAGKSTLGQALSQRTGWPFHDEIGKRLGRDPAFRGSRVRTSDGQPRFDREVFAREVARDRLFELESPGRPRIVETWHPGNLAYAAMRSPEVALATLPHVRTAIDWARVVVLPVSASSSALEARRQYPEDVSYFIGVAAVSLAIARGLGATLLSPVMTHDRSPGELVVRVLPRLEGLARALCALPPTCRPNPIA